MKKSIFKVKWYLIIGLFLFFIFNLYTIIFGSNGYFARLEKEKVLESLKKEKEKCEADKEKHKVYLEKLLSEDITTIENEARRNAYAKADDIVIKLKYDFNDKKDALEEEYLRNKDSLLEINWIFISKVTAGVVAVLLTFLFLFWFFIIPKRKQNIVE